MEYPVLVGPYMDTSKVAHERFEELYCLEQNGELLDESPEWAELLVLRALLLVNPGDTVTFEKSFPDLCDDDSDASTETKASRGRILEAWTRVREMIEMPAESQ